MKTPGFWHTKNTLSTLLLPFSWVYAAGFWLQQTLSASPLSLPVPVICIGNLTAGGAGKTPVAIAIGERLKAKNIAACFLSRGYGGAARGPLLVNPLTHSARDVGDEPLLLARTLPTIVAKNRLNGAMFALKQGVKIIIMDDGFQNPSVEKTLSLLVVDGAYGFGNGRLLPAGPLRETPDSGFARTDAVIVVGKKSMEFPPNLPVISASIQPETGASALEGRNVLAFCGLAFPQKFFDTLTLLGALITDTTVFADHHPYSEAEIKHLHERAKQQQAILVTTAKDAARLQTDWMSLVTVVNITLVFEHPDTLDALLDKVARAS
jgi:tetraacyldisaccharide 4'-kinase